jgi:CBS domain-containing protein
MYRLKLHHLAPGDELAWPIDSETVSLDTPAVEFFADFENDPPLTIQASTRAVDAKQLMLKSQVKLLFVLSDHLGFVGIISSGDLIDRRIVQRISEGYRREDILVRDLMVPKANLLAMDIDEARKARVGDVITALKTNGQQHCLVLDPETHRIRGVFSAEELSRKLHLPIDVQDRTSFYRAFCSVA